MPKFFNTLEAQVGNFTIQNSADDKDITFKSDNGSGGLTEYFRMDGSAVQMFGSVPLKLGDSKELWLGNASDFYLTHDGTNNFIIAQNGPLYIRQTENDQDIIFESDDGSGGTTEYFKLDGSATRTVFSRTTRHTDGVIAQFGTSGDLGIQHDGTDSTIANAVGDLIISNDANDKDIIFKCDTGGGGLATYFFLDGSLADSTYKYTRWVDYSVVSLGTGNDFQLFHDSTKSRIENLTGNLEITQKADDADIVFRSDDGSGGTADYFRVVGSDEQIVFSKDVKLKDSILLKIGDSADFKLSHNGTLSTILNETGNLLIKNQANDSDIVFQCDDGSGGLAEYFRVDGGTEDIRFSKNTRHLDNVRAEFGNSGDFDIYYDGSNAYVVNGGSAAGDIQIINNTDDGDIKFFSDDGTGSTTEYFRLDGGLGYSVASKHIQMVDGKAVYYGSGNDLGIYHSSNNSFIENITGDLTIQNTTDDADIIFKSDNGSGGLMTYFSIDGSDVRINVNATNGMQFMDDVKAKFGTSGDLTIRHDSSNSIIENSVGDLRFTNKADDKDIVFQTDDGSGAVTTYFFLDGSRADGTYIYTEFPDNSVIGLGNDTDFQLYHDGSNSLIDNFVGHLIIQQRTDDKDIIFKSDDGSGGVAEYFRLDGGTTSIIASKNVELLDNVELKIGTGNDLNIRHSGTESFIQNQTGNLTIQNLTDDADIIFKSDNGSGGVIEYLRLDGSEERLTVNAPNGMLFFDDIKAKFGTGSDLQIYHNSTTGNGIIENGTGDLVIQNNLDDSDILFRSDDGSGGVTEYFRLDGGLEKIVFSKNIMCLDNVKAQFGDSNDLQIYHDGTNSYIQDNGTGDLLVYFDNEFKVIKNGSSEVCIEATADGSVDLYHDNSLKFATTSSGVAVTGGITLSGNVEGREIPFVIRSSFDDMSNSTSIFVIPWDANVETTVSGADEEHIFVAPYAGKLKKVQFKHVKGSLSSSFTTELKFYKNGSSVAASGELTASNDAITWAPTSSNTFSANDELMIAYQKSATSKYWQHVSVSVVFSFTNYDI